MATKEHILIYGATGYMGRLIARAARTSGLPVVLAGRNREKLAQLGAELDLPYRVVTLETPAEREARLERERRTPLMAQDSAGRAPRHAETKPDTRNEALEHALDKVRLVLKGAGRFPSTALPFVEQSERHLKQAQAHAHARKNDSLNAALDRALADVKVVVNAAGPFAETAMPLARACVRTRTDYTDIAGEYDVLNELNDLGEDAAKVGSVLMPGVGLTVMASDLLVRYAIHRVGKKMGRPHVVRVALSRTPFVSRGSAKTMMASVRDGVRLIRNSEYRHAPVGTLVRSFAFNLTTEGTTSDTRICTAMTLADLLTVGDTAQRQWDPEAWTTPRDTPNVETYVEASGVERLGYEVGAEFALALRSQPVKGIVEKALNLWPEGPGSEDRDQSRQLVAVEIEDRYRRGVEVRLSTRNSYDFTVEAALHVACHLFARPPTMRGFLSPAWATDDVDRLFAALVPDGQHVIAYRGLR